MSQTVHPHAALPQPLSSASGPTGTGMAPGAPPLREQLAYGLGNFMPTAVTATGGMAMFFYTDVAGLSAAFIGALLLLVRIGDAVWDIGVGRRVDATRTAQGQARPYLLWCAPLLALALVASFSIPAGLGETARHAWVVIAYVALWCGYSLVQIPYQSLLPLVAPDPDHRLRMAGVSSLVQFIFVIGCAAGFPMLKDALSDGDPARGFQRAALAYAGVGLAFTWLCYAGVRERVLAPPASTRGSLGPDLRALTGNRCWRVGIAVQCVLGVLIGLPLSAGVYYFTAVVQQPQLIGPFMGLGGIGLVLGVLLSDRLTRRWCKRRVFILACAAAAVLQCGYLLPGLGAVPAVFVLGLLCNVCLGLSAPISASMNGDIADAVEHDSGRRVVGTLVATVNFASKVGAGLVSAIVGLTLSLSHYQAGAAAQSDLARHGVLALMSVIPALAALGVALLLARAYPLDRAALQRLRDELARRRALQAAAQPHTH
ncbi:MAG: hypothetical protein RLY78_4241 [Pseudomonadota bacterium]